MLLINAKISSAEEVLNQINKSFNKDYSVKTLKNVFAKNPDFKINPVTNMIDLGTSAKRGSKVYKQAPGIDILTRFKYFCPVDNKEVEIRYADTQPHFNTSNQKMVYKPKSIDLAGPYHSVSSSDSKGFEKMLFIYLHPTHLKSPLNKPGSVYRYSHVNQDEVFQNKAEANNRVIEALKHSETLVESELVIFAKSLGIDVTGRTHEQVKTLIQSFLLAGERNVTAYHKHMKDQSHVFVGRIIDAIDNKMIVSQKTGNGITWSFNTAKNKSTIVVVQAGNDAKQTLIEHIKGNISEYHPIIMALSKENLSNKNYEDYFKKLDSGDIVEADGKMKLDDVVDFKSSYDFLCQHFQVETFYKKNASVFLEEVLKGDITEENFEEEVAKFAPKNKS